MYMNGLALQLDWGHYDDIYFALILFVVFVLSLLFAVCCKVF